MIARFLPLIMIVLSATSAPAVHAATIVMDGFDSTAGNTSHTYPFGGNTRDIQIYDPTVWFPTLSGTVEISSIGFRRNNNFGLESIFPDFEVRMSSLPAGSAFTAGTEPYASLHGADVSLVKDGGLTIAATADNLEFFQIGLDASFTWDTSQSLVIEMFSRNGGVTNGFNVQAQNGLAETWRKYSAGNGDDAITTVNRLDILQLTFEPASEAPAPAGLWVALGALVLLRLHSGHRSSPRADRQAR